MNEYPKSWNLERLKTKDDRYIVTAAGWATEDGCESYEIGIRDLKEPGFKLIQAQWDCNTVKKAAFAIVKLLDSGMFMHDLHEIFP